MVPGGKFGTETILHRGEIWQQDNKETGQFGTRDNLAAGQFGTICGLLGTDTIWHQDNLTLIQFGVVCNVMLHFFRKYVKLHHCLLSNVKHNMVKQKSLNMRLEPEI